MPENTRAVRQTVPSGNCRRRPAFKVARQAAIMASAAAGTAMAAVCRSRFGRTAADSA